MEKFIHHMRWVAYTYIFTAAKTCIYVLRAPQRYHATQMRYSDLDRRLPSKCSFFLTQEQTIL